MSRQLDCVAGWRVMQVLRAGQATGQRDIAALGDTLPEEVGA